jgi:hypothetical protein
MTLDMTEGSPDWRDALSRAIELVRARDAGPGPFSDSLRDEMQRVVDDEEPMKAAALAAGSAITLAYKLALSLQFAMAEFAGSAVTLEQVLEWVQGQLEMYSGVAQAEQGGLDELLSRDES